MLWKRDTTSSNPFVELALAEVRDWQQQSQSFYQLRRDAGHGVRLRLCA